MVGKYKITRISSAMRQTYACQWLGISPKVIATIRKTFALLQPYSHKPAATPNPSDLIFLCITPRVGSWWLVDLLRSTGLFGNPGEYLDLWAFSQFLPTKKFQSPDLPSYVSALQHKFGAANGRIIIKTGIYGIQLMLAAGMLETLRQARFIYMSRNDLLGQTISDMIAKQTDAWVSTHEKKKNPRYSYTAINHHMRKITRQRAAFDSFFAASNITPLRVTYEELQRNPQQVVNKVGAFCGLDAPLTINSEQLQFKKQANQTNAKFSKRYLAETTAALRSITTIPHES